MNTCSAGFSRLGNDIQGPLRHRFSDSEEKDEEKGAVIK